MKLKYIVVPLLMLLLCSLLCLSASAAEGGGFNAGLAVDRSNEANGSFTVTVQHSDVLVEKQPSLRLPCSFETAQVILPDETVQTGTVADGQVTFRVSMGGTYTIADGGAKPQTEVKLEVFSETSIPQELKGNENLNTVEKIEAAMVAKIETYIEAEEEIEVQLYDAKLKYFDTTNGNWVDADEQHFPADRCLTVTIDIPAGTHPDTHEYTVVHMFTSSFNDKTPGDMERPECHVRQNEDGSYYLEFVVTGLSPIMVAWTEKQIEEEEEEEPGISSYLILMLLKMKQEYNIIVEPTEGGKVILTDEKVKFGKSTTFTVVPDTGFEIGTVTVNNRAVKDVDGVVTINRIGRDQIIKVVFAQLLTNNP